MPSKNRNQYKEPFIPALRFSSLNSFYDRLTLWAFKKTSFYHVIEEVKSVVAPQQDMSILDLGCGPGRLAIRFKKNNPRCKVTAVDRDPKILELAKKNARQAGAKIHFVQQDLATLTFSNTFDRIYSTFVFHHLPVESKKCTLNQLRKLLKPGGQFVLADFCQSHGLLEKLTFLPVQWIDGFKTTSPHIQGWLEKELNRYFSKVEQKARITTFLGPAGVFVCHV